MPRTCIQQSRMFGSAPVAARRRTTNASFRCGETLSPGATQVGQNCLCRFEVLEHDRQSIDRVLFQVGILSAADDPLQQLIVF